MTKHLRKTFRAETTEEREERRLAEDLYRAEFIRERLARCWSTGWQATARDENGRPTHYELFTLGALRLVAANVPTVRPAGL